MSSDYLSFSYPADCTCARIFTYTHPIQRMAGVGDHCSQQELENMELLRRPWVQQLIWITGGHRNGIRSLNRQVVLGRQIIVSEDISLHLITQDGKIIFLKPLPRGLFNDDGELELSGKPDLDAILRGFVWTYIMMVQSQIGHSHHIWKVVALLGRWLRCWQWMSCIGDWGMWDMMQQGYWWRRNWFREWTWQVHGMCLIQVGQGTSKGHAGG
jgi:hypothetical protein